MLPYKVLLGVSTESPSPGRLACQLTTELVSGQEQGLLNQSSREQTPILTAH